MDRRGRQGALGAGFSPPLSGPVLSSAPKTATFREMTRVQGKQPPEKGTGPHEAAPRGTPRHAAGGKSGWLLHGIQEDGAFKLAADQRAEVE